MLTKMLARLEEMESVVRRDAGRPRVRTDAVEEPSAVSRGSVEPAAGGVEEVVARLERATQSPHQAFLRQLRFW